MAWPGDRLGERWHRYCRELLKHGASGESRIHCFRLAHALTGSRGRLQPVLLSPAPRRARAVRQPRRADFAGPADDTSDRLKAPFSSRARVEPHIAGKAIVFAF